MLITMHIVNATDRWPVFISVSSLPDRKYRLLAGIRMIPDVAHGDSGGVWRIA